MYGILEQNYTTPTLMRIRGDYDERFAEILTPEALEFITALHTRFNEERKALLWKRQIRQQAIDEGQLPDFLPETAHIRDSIWQVAPIPVPLQDRRVEITGPVERKMIINALNSGAKVFMADFEDSNSPTWANTIEGQINLRDAILGTIDYTHPANGKRYVLNDEIATLIIRPRGWHLIEKHIEIDGEPTSGGLVDFGLYLYHNARKLIENGEGPYFYLPKMESHLEAQLWNKVFVFAQDYLDIPQGTIKATVLIETILASFELNEIIYELRDHMAGLNCGRWDYIFSYIKRFRNLPGFTLPERAQVTMTVPFMKAYSDLVIHTCHKRGCLAIGGMAAQIPIKDDPERNKAAIEKVRQDKLREVMAGHDGTWVAHPGLVSVAKAIFDEHMPQPNQLDKLREDVSVSAEDLLAVPNGTITEEGLRMNINVGILYIESWLRGVGAAAIYHLMEDAATAEISRTQVWQWIKNDTRLEDGRRITFDLCNTIIGEELKKIQRYVGEDAYESGRFQEAVDIFTALIEKDEFIEFLTISSYNFLK